MFFLLANKTSVLSKLTSMQDLESSNWIILDLLGNIYEIYADLTVMTLLISTTFQYRKLISKRHICKSKFHVCYHFCGYL